MSMRTARADSPHRYRPMPIRAAFGPCHRNVRFCLRYGRAIALVRPATHHPSYITVRITGLIVTSCQRATIQIPIALRSSLTTPQHPAVSSLEASPTPAH